MRRRAWMDRWHEIVEDVDDCSMCLCGISKDTHYLVWPTDDTAECRDCRRAEAIASSGVVLEHQHS